MRIAPLKIRRVANMVKGREVNEALSILRFSPTGGAKVLFKLVTAAQANAYQDGESRSSELFVRNLIVDQGPDAKRIKPRARGSRDIIRKRTSHVTVVVDDGQEEA